MVTPVNKPASQTAGQKTAPEGVKTGDGLLTSLKGDQLKIKSRDGREFSRTLAKDAKSTCDGVVCKPADLKPGSKIRFTSSADDRNVVTCIESIVEKTDFAG